MYHDRFVGRYSNLRTTRKSYNEQHCGNLGFGDFSCRIPIFFGEADGGCFHVLGPKEGKNAPIHANILSF